MQAEGRPPRRRVRWGVSLALLLAAASARAIPVAIDPSTGALSIGNFAPGNWQVKVEVGPAPGQVKVIDRQLSQEYVFGGITRIDARTGAGSEFLEFDIVASQSLALNLDTGSGDASVKIRWKVPPGAAATASTLSMASGAGAVTVELDFESETAQSSFVWANDFGGGNKNIQAQVGFKSGSVDVLKDISFTRLGGGTHRVAVEVDSQASRADLRFDAGFAQEVGYKLTSSDPSASLMLAAATRAVKSAVEVLSAATATRVALRGGFATVSQAEAKYAVTQTAAGSLEAWLDLAPSVASTKIETQFESPSPQLTLGGRIATGSGADTIKVGSNLRTVSSLAISGAGGDDVIEALFGAGSSATTAIDCGAGTDVAKASVGTARNCETFGR